MADGGDNVQTADPATADPEVKKLFTAVTERAPREAAKLLDDYSDEVIVDTLELLNPGQAQDLLSRMRDSKRETVFASAPPETVQQWMRNQTYPDQTIGRLMQPPLAVFHPNTTVYEATEHIRRLSRKAIITYGFVVDEEEKLMGVLVMRDMLLAKPDQTVSSIMLPDPFYLTPEMTLTNAMKAVLMRHYPVYPVCTYEGRVLGLMRGQMLFEAQAVELSAQPGSMVGVEKEERLTTRWPRSLRLRHPWLQTNLFLGFIAAAVMGGFEATIDRILALAVFVPVLIGQSSNTAVQTLSVALRAMTLGELRAGQERQLIAKETLLGALNGVFTGVSAAAGMLVFAWIQNNPDGRMLAWVVFLATTISCSLAGVAGAMVPIIMRRLGSDPVTASSIVLTTITDVATLSVFLGLATWLI